MSPKHVHQIHTPFIERKPKVPFVPDCRLNGAGESSDQSAIAKFWLIPILLIFVIVSLLGFAVIFPCTFGTCLYSSPPKTITLISLTCSTTHANCVFVLNNPGSPSQVMNINLYQSYNAADGQWVGKLESLSPNATLPADSDQTITIPLPNTLRSGSTANYELDFSNGQSVSGSFTVQ